MRSTSLLSVLAALTHLSAAHHDRRLQQDSSSAEQHDPSGSSPARHAAIAARLAHESPFAVRKMSTDPSAMFFPAYWGFTDDVTQTGADSMLNSSASSGALQPAILPIFTSGSRSPPPSPLLPRLFAPPLQRRSFNCPADTTVCSSIGRSDACCPTGLSCVLVDSGTEVGCCAAGADCDAGALASCPAGYTQCSDFGGGCCIPGYQCVQGGCVGVGTATVVVTPTSTSTPTPTPTSTSTSTTPTTSAIPTTSSSTSSSPTPTSLPTSTSSAPSTASVLPPQRPTSAAASSASPPPPPSTTSDACPTGYYQCSAYYNSGACCQVGRDCGLTSCPAQTSATLLASNGVTVLAPAADITAAPQQGQCAHGWFNCPASDGGNCCPTGFLCGTASCWLNATAVPGNGQGTGKEDATSGAPGPVEAGALWVLAVLVVVAWM